MSVYIKDFMLGVQAGIPQFRGQKPLSPQQISNVNQYMLALFSLCCLANPDVVLDIGTGQGKSGLAMLLALRALGKPMKSFTTFDLRGGNWRDRVPRFYKALLAGYGIRIARTNMVKADFKKLDAAKFVPTGKRVFLFYDIHDHHGGKVRQPEASSPHLLKNWLPRISEGIVAVHDMSPVPRGYVATEKVLKQHVSYSQAIHAVSGQLFKGYGECKNIITWLNQHRGQLIPVPFTSLVYFRMKDGKPC